MRTTLDIDDDVLMAAKELARTQRSSAGKVLSELARNALTQKPVLATRNGFPQLPVQPNARPVTLELVNQLRDALP